MVIRRSQPFDVVRYAVLGGPAPGNRAKPFASLASHTATAMSRPYALQLAASLQGKDTCALTQIYGRYVPSIVAARPRCSRSSWDVSHLFVDSEDDPRCEDILNVLSQEVSQRGGERVFLRLREDDPLVEVASHCGFRTYQHETLFQGPRKVFSGKSSLPVRPMIDPDRHDVFRLYNASTPTRTRLALGMNLDQWESTRERAGWRAREFVYKHEDVVRGWLQTTQWARSGAVTLLNHSDYEDRLSGLVQHGASRMWGAKVIWCIVPDYQVRLGALLKQRGFQETGRYVSLMRSIATPVPMKDPAHAVRLKGIGPTIDLSERWQRAKREDLVNNRSS